MRTPFRSAGEVTPTLTREDEERFIRAVGRGDNRPSIAGIISAIIIMTMIVTVLSLLRT